MTDSVMSENKDVRMRGTTAVDISESSGAIHPFLTSKKSFIHTLGREMTGVFGDPQAKRILGLSVLNILCTVILLVWCSSTNSMALTAYAYLNIFDILCLLSCLVSIWVQQQKPSPIFSFGYERFEVLAVFASTILAQFGSLFIIKESIERMLVQPEIHTGRLLVGTALAFSFHILVTYTLDNRALNHVIVAASSSWLQEHVSDMSESICNVVPGFSKLLLPRINPFALIAFAGATALMFVYLLIDIRNFYSADTWAALWIAMMTCGTMFPMSVYSGKILLQTTPSHIIGQLDKSIREASTLDGVLEFRNEHFWNLTFGTMAGSVHVRVRRDADEQLVLAHVYNRLSNLVSELTVQIFKDDWSRPSALHLLNSLSGPTFTSPGSAAPGAQSPPVRSSSATSPPYGLSPPSVILPSRTDTAVAGSYAGVVPPALRLAAANLNRAPSPQPPVAPLPSTGGVISMNNLGDNRVNSYLGSGLQTYTSPPSQTPSDLGISLYSPPGSRLPGQQQGPPTMLPQSLYRNDNPSANSNPQKTSIGKQT